MPSFGASGIANFALSGLSFFFGIVMIGLSGYLTHVGNTDEALDGYPVGVSRFMLFVSIWTIFFTLVLPLAALTQTRIVGIATSAIAGLTVIFLFAGWVAVATKVGAHNYDFTGHIYYSGGNMDIPEVTFTRNPYRCAAADAVFGALEWVTWIGITVLGGLSARGGAKGRV